MSHATAAPLPVLEGRENRPCAPEPPAAGSTVLPRQPLLASQPAPLRPNLQLPACCITSRKRPASAPETSGACKRPHVAPLCDCQDKQQRQERLQGLLDLFEGLPLPPSPVAVERRISIEQEVHAAARAPAAAPAAGGAEAAAHSAGSEAAAAAWPQPCSSSASESGNSRSPSPQASEQAAQQPGGDPLHLLAAVASMQHAPPASPPQHHGPAASPPACVPPASTPASPPAPVCTSPRPPLPPQLRPQLRQLKRLLTMLAAVQAAAAQPAWREAAARQPATAAVLHRLRQLSRAQQLQSCSPAMLQRLLAQFCGCA